MIKRLSLYSKISSFIFAASIGLHMVNDIFLKKKVPGEIIGYVFWFSLGLFIGVNCCIDVVKRFRKEPKDLSQRENLN